MPTGESGWSRVPPMRRGTSTSTGTTSAAPRSTANALRSRRWIVTERSRWLTAELAWRRFSDGEWRLDGRKASMRIGSIAESRIQPIRNPVDDSKHRVRIDLPDGFEYKIAEIANTVSATSNAEAPLDMSLENSYGQLNEFDWAPA